MTRTLASRDQVDVLRTRFWYEGLCIQLGVTSAYALEQKIEPDAFKKNDDNVAIHRNKWWRYRCGMHTPSPSTCAQTDRIVPGSTAELNHVLWRVLRKEHPAIETTHLLRQLAPELQVILFEGRDKIRAQGGLRLLGKLETRASLDVLACLTILLRANYEAGHGERVWEFAQRIFRVLLILACKIDERRIAAELFELYRIRIFSLAKWDGQKFILDDYSYLVHAQILLYFIDASRETMGRRSEWHKQVQAMRRILDGKLGFSKKILLAPPIGLDLDLGPPAQQQVLQWQRGLQLREWSIKNLKDGGEEHFPPAELWKESPA